MEKGRLYISNIHIVMSIDKHPLDTINCEKPMEMWDKLLIILVFIDKSDITIFFSKEKLYSNVMTDEYQVWSVKNIHNIRVNDKSNNDVSRYFNL